MIKGKSSRCQDFRKTSSVSVRGLAFPTSDHGFRLKLSQFDELVTSWILFYLLSFLEHCLNIAPGNWELLKPSCEG